MQKIKVYTILVLDVEQCCCADIYSDGEINVLFKEHSEVPHKHRKGGQSAARFSRIRQNEIILWFKRINEYLKKIDSEIYVGINSIYASKFKKYLNTYNLQKIKHIDSTEYTDLSGIYQYFNRLKENGKK